MFDPIIKGQINASKIKIGKGVVIEDGAVINAEEVILGDFCFIGQNAKILVPSFKIGDYSKLHNYSFAHGDKPLHIGNCCWVGGNVVLDSLGGLTMDDGVGIGAHSQIWTHIQFGDIVEGCRFYSKKKMYIGKDAWFVGQCLISPVEVGERSMALLGSVITKKMEPNHVYGGSPAVDLTGKIGTQFETRTVQQKIVRLTELINSFEKEYPEYTGLLQPVDKYGQNMKDDVTYFNLSDRTYTKKCNMAEIKFLKKYVPLIKFYPDRK